MKKISHVLAFGISFFEFSFSDQFPFYAINISTKTEKNDQIPISFSSV